MWDFIHERWKDIVFTVGSFTALMLFWEKAFNKKFIGSWVFRKLKSLLFYRYQTQKTLTSLLNEVKQLREEYKTLLEVLEDVKLNYFLLDDTDEAMRFRMDAFGKCEWANRAFYKFFGHTEKSILGMNWETVISKNDISQVQEMWRHKYVTQSEYRNYCGILDNNGNEFPCLVEAIPIQTPSAFKGFYGKVTLLNNET